jgi:hypothetical protein
MERITDVAGEWWVIRSTDEGLTHGHGLASLSSITFAVERIAEWGTYATDVFFADGCCSHDPSLWDA